jgi:hypothetical protein
MFAASVRRDVLQARPLAARLHYVPDSILRDATAPHLSLPGDRSEDFALRDIRSACPVVESGFDPVWNRHGANVATLADQIDQCASGFHPTLFRAQPITGTESELLDSFHATDPCYGWYCSEPRLAFNRIAVVRYRMYLESRHLTANTINQQLAAVRRLAHEAAAAGLLSLELSMAYS